MSPARRSIKRRDWPRGLREPRPGYYAWEDSKGKIWPLGRVDLAVAKADAAAANLFEAGQAVTLVQRLAEGPAGRTVAELLAKMTPAANQNTAKTDRTNDGKINRKLGTRLAGNLAVADCAELLEELTDQDKLRAAEALRSRLIAVCQKGMALGWMDRNPAEVTEKPTVTVRRGRMTLEMFHAVYAKAPDQAEWLQHAMMLALVSGQDRSTVAAMERSHVAGGVLTTWRTKTRGTNQPISIPLKLRLDVVGVSLAELVAHKTGVLSRHLVHHVNPWGNAPAGSPVHPDRITHAFTAARQLAGIPDMGPDGKGAPTFHEIRSLAKRLYKAQGNVDTQALLGHATARMGELYEDPRGVEPIVVRVS